MRNLILALAVSFVPAAYAEVFYEINYLESLSEIKQTYPGATYEKLKPAWLKSDQAFIKISGQGLPHAIRVAFIDTRPIFKEALSDPEQKHNAEKFMRLMNSSDDDALRVDWVRVTYDPPIPIEKFKKKYGKSTCYTDDDFEEVCEFPSRAIVAGLTSNGKFVYKADTKFTKNEKDKGMVNLKY